MKISIITVCFNSAATIEETIQSVLAQSHPDKEYIIVDGNSSDGTKEIIARYTDRISHFISESDKGIYDAMNKGLKLATGDIISILNSDDLYKDPEVLSRVDSAFKTDIDCLCTDVEIFNGLPGNVVRYYSCTRWKKWMFRLGHQPPHPGFFVRRTCYETAGVFDTGFKLGADFDLLLRFIGKQNFKVDFQPWVSVSMRGGGASQQSLKNISRANMEVHKSMKKNGYFSLLFLIWLKYPLKVFQFLLR